MIKETQELPPEDDAFDRYFSDQFKTPGDSDVTLMSRAVLNNITTHSRTNTHPFAEVVSAPAPWIGGFSGMLLFMGCVGYASVPLLDGGMTAFLSDFAILFDLLGGLK